MSGVEMRESWSIAPPVEADATRNQLTMRAWAEAYGLIPRLMPFEQRAGNPIAVVETIRSHLDGMPPTAATTRLSYIQDEFPFRGARVPDVEPLLEMLGSWNSQVNENSNLERSWVNPDYVHLKSFEPNVTDAAERREIIERVAGYGVVQVKDIAPRFGMTERATTRWMHRHEIPWTELRHAGIGRMARTCCTIAEWTEWTQADIARSLDIEPSTLRSAIQEHARTVGFEIPEDPSGEPWFTRKSFTSEGSR